MAGISVQVEEVMNKLVLKTLNASKNGVHNCLSEALENLVLRTVQKVMDSPELISRFSDAVIDNPGFITPVTALVKS